MNGGLGEVIGLLIALPFVAAADYFKYIKELPPGGQQELAKACHGIGMLALLAYWFPARRRLCRFRDDAGAASRQSLYWIPVGIAASGLGWVLLNARFAAQSVVQPHRATMIVRGLIKSAVGYAIWAFASDAEAPLDRAAAVGRRRVVHGDRRHEGSADDLERRARRRRLSDGRGRHCVERIRLGQERQ